MEQNVTGGRGLVAGGRSAGQKNVLVPSTRGRGCQTVQVEKVSCINLVKKYSFCRFRLIWRILLRAQ